ncbi:Hpt domain-containing protein [Leeuwenhoekiella sp. NPDC079379]|uniref:Hpt domain-containing protein n=1 Tax=Leeuwenhoekiella sp. NPDC079379 TaxID=3364122 RepID=UPI0037CB4E61
MAVRTRKKHIIFIDSNLKSQTAFSSIIRSSEASITNFTTGMGAIQFIKQSELPDLIIIEEHIKPLGALQTLKYLNDQLNYCGSALIISDSKDKIYTDTHVYGVLSKGFLEEDILKVRSLLNNMSDNRLYTEPAFSLNYLKNLSDNDLEFILESLKIFKDSVTVRLEEMETKLKILDLESVREIAHNIKPSFEMLENVRGSEVCDKIAHVATPKEIDILVEKLKVETTKIIIGIDKDFPTLSE